MDDPIAFFITVATYGTWLPGEQRGWLEYQRGWQLPDPLRELEAEGKMTDAACVLNTELRAVVEAQVRQTCNARKWFLHAVNCRTNHLHTVLSAAHAKPQKVRVDLKAWCTRRLKQAATGNRENWWAERGSMRWIFDEEQLASVIDYVNDAQDRKHLDRQLDQLLIGDRDRHPTRKF